MHTTINALEFINSVYIDLPHTETVLILKPSATGMRQYPATDRKLKQIERKAGEWYVCVSSVEKADPLRRRKQDCRTIYVVMLDDIGTKADAPPVDPSIILETSEGNYQYLYLIHPYELTGDAEVEYFEACNRAMVGAGWGDKGAQGVARIYRLPGSVNTKKGRNNWQTRVTHWDPDVVWSLDGLMDDMSLKPVYKEKKVVNAEYGIEIPEGFKDSVLDYLQERTLLGDRQGDFFDIRCPWAHEHTGGEDKAGYSPLGYGDVPLVRGFNCFHEHCQGRTATDFLAWVGQQEGGPKVNAVGINEIEAETLRKHVGELDSSQRIKLLYGSIPSIHKSSLPQCVVTAKGIPKDSQKPTKLNIQYIMDSLHVKTRFNLQTRRVEAMFNDEKLAEISNDPADVIRAVIDTALMAGINSTKDVREIAGDAASSDRYHPFEDWVLSAKWDGISRLDALTNTVTVSNEYATIWPVYLKRWLIQCVQGVRGWREPVQLKSVLVLAGKQGVGKTTFFSRLVPREFFKEGVQLALKGNGHKDSVMTATKFPIVELGELDSTFSKSESGALKAFISDAVDTYRKPYGYENMDYPRCTSFCGSVNRIDFLIDETGSSRYWPVLADSINTYHDIDMQQLWAEVNLLWESGEKYLLNADEEALRHMQSEEFTTVIDAQESALGWLDSHELPGVPMTVTDFCKMINISTNRGNLSSISQILRSTLGDRKRQLKKVRNAWMIPITAKKESKLELIENMP